PCARRRVLLRCLHDRGTPVTAGTGAARVEARLRELLVAGDLAGLRSYVDTLSADERAAAKAWTAKRQDIDGWTPPPEMSHLRHREQTAWRDLVGWGRV